MFTDFHVNDYGRVVNDDDIARFVLRELSEDSTHSFVVIDLNNSKEVLAWVDTFEFGVDIIDALNTAALVELMALQNNSKGPVKNHPDVTLDSPPESE